MTASPGGGAQPSLVAVELDVAPEHVDDATLALGEFSPGGFAEEDLPDGGRRFVLYVPIGDELRAQAWLAQQSVPVSSVRTQLVAPDWSERWKEFHQPVTIGGLWVGPPWQVADAPAGLKRVVVEPGQGFGTGAHATTRLVLALLQEQPRASLLDLGCGSGVLSVAAALLGFAPVTAVDNDPAAVASTRDNLERNGVQGVTLRLLDALQEELPRADVVVANIMLEPLLRLAPRMRAPRLVLSGLLRSQADTCAAAYEQVGYVLRERRDRDGWVALVLDDSRPDAAAMQHRSVW